MFAFPLVPVGPNQFDYGGIFGVRSTGGVWLNDDHTLGVESSGFYLSREGDGSD